MGYSTLAQVLYGRWANPPAASARLVDSSPFV